MSSEGGGGSGATGESESAEQEESSSSSSSSSTPNVQGMEELLESFRQQWQRELEPSCSPQSVTDNKQTGDSSEPTEQEDSSKVTLAGQLFLQGVTLEEQGSLHAAISCYRRAVQLVPDIEGRLYQQEAARSAQQTPQHNKKEGNVRPRQHNDDKKPENEEPIEEDLLAKFQLLQSLGEALCTPDTNTTGGHICQLPPELLAQLFCWVVSSDLDLRSLENCAQVCRAFYLVARSDGIWRRICARVWGPSSEPNVSSWREEYISRYRLHFNGCYISRTSYIRPGEQSFRDASYHFWHAVEYYRYVRFFPGGTVLMLTSAEEPATALTHLRYRQPRNPAVLQGRYTLCGPRVSMELRPAVQNTPQAININNNRYRGGRRRGLEVQHDSGEKTFHVELQINAFKNRNNVQLTWVRYFVETKYRAAPVTVCPFELCPSKFPPLWFSRVLSYTGPAETSL